MVKIGIIPARLLRYRQTKKSRKSALFLWQRYKNLNASVQNLVTRFARNNDSANPYFFAEEENRHPMVPVFLLAEV